MCWPRTLNQKAEDYGMESIPSFDERNPVLEQSV